MIAEDVKFDIYDIVAINGMTPTGVVMDYDYQIRDGALAVVYRVYADGKYVSVWEDEMKKVGHVNTGLTFGEKVRVRPADPETGRGPDAPGVVNGISYNPETGQLGFSVALSDDETEFFTLDQLVMA